MGPQRFVSVGASVQKFFFVHYPLISGSVVLSPNRRFANPSKRAGDSQNFRRLSNTDALVYLHRLAILPAFRWLSSEKEMKLSNPLAASSFFHNFRRSDLRYLATDLSDILTNL